MMSSACLDAYYAYSMEVESFKHGFNNRSSDQGLMDLTMHQESCVEGSGLNTSRAWMLEKCTDDDMIWDYSSQQYVAVPQQISMYREYCKPCESAYLDYYIYTMIHPFDNDAVCDKESDLNRTIMQVQQKCPLDYYSYGIFGNMSIGQQFVGYNTMCDPCLATMSAGFECKTAADMCDESNPCYSQIRDMDEFCTDSHTYQDEHGNVMYVREQISYFLVLLNSDFCNELEHLSECDRAVTEEQWPETCAGEDGPQLENVCLHECQPLFSKVWHQCSVNYPPLPMKGHGEWDAIYMAIEEKLASCPYHAPRSCLPVLVDREQFQRLKAVRCSGV
jgi:hypothetical protein